jgi:hypothetical protein
VNTSNFLSKIHFFFFRSNLQRWQELADEHQPPPTSINTSTLTNEITDSHQLVSS